MYFKMLRWHKTIAFIEVRILRVFLVRLAQCCLTDYSLRKVKDIWPLKTPLSLLLLPTVSHYLGMYKRVIASVRYTKLINLLLTCAWVKPTLQYWSFEHSTSRKMWTYQKVLWSKQQKRSALENLIKRSRKNRTQLRLRGGRISLQIYKGQL